jgi:hypothetical protein
MTEQQADRQDDGRQHEPRPPIEPRRGLSSRHEPHDFHERPRAADVRLGEIAANDVTLVRVEQRARQIRQRPPDASGRPGHLTAHATPRLMRITM